MRRLQPADGPALFDDAQEHARPVSRQADTWVARTADDVESIRPLWQDRQGGCFTADIDVFLTNVRHNPEIVRPHVVVVGEGDSAALVVGRLVHAPVLPRRWTTAVVGPRIPVIEVVYGGFLGGRAPALAAAALTELRGALEKGEAAAIVFRSLERGAPLWRAVADEVPFHLRRRDAATETHHLLYLESSLEQILATRKPKLRENVHRCLRRVESEVGAELELRVYRDPASAPILFDEVDAIASRSRHRRERGLFTGSELERTLVELGLERGWFRAYLLSIAGEPAAFWTGFAYGGAFGWRGVTGYDERYRRLGIGTYTFARMVDDLCRDPDVGVFDFGFGDAHYKRAFANGAREEQTVRVFGTGLRSIGFNLADSALHGAKLVGQRVPAQRADIPVRKRTTGLP
jgi:CelD/BcsL family acetyltransferase involved in cellulose biosynthesis